MTDDENPFDTARKAIRALRPRKKPVSREKRLVAGIVRPSKGPAYVRCPTCKAQIFAPLVTPQTPLLHIAFLLHPRVRQHNREAHDG